MAKSLKVQILEHISSVVGDRFDELNEGESFVLNLENKYIKELLEIQDPDKLIKTINLWIEEEPKDEIEEAEKVIQEQEEGENGWRWFINREKREWGLIKKITDAAKAIEFKSIKINKIVYVLLGILFVFVVYLGFVQVVKDPDLYSIDLQKFSGGQVREVTEQTKLLRWDWSIFALWWESFDSNNYIHLFAVIIGLGVLVNVLKDASDNASGGNWAAVVGGIVFVFSFASMSPLIAATITVTACIVQWRDRHSFQGVWVAPILLLTVALILNRVGENYLSWSPENFTGLMRMMFHWGYTLPTRSIWMICYTIIICFTLLVGFSKNKKSRDSSGQAWIHLSLSLYSLISGVIPFSQYWGKFTIPEKLGDINRLTLFVIGNALIALILEIRELFSQSTADREVGNWVGIGLFITYIAEVCYVTLASSRAFNFSFLLSLTIGMIFPTFFLGAIVLGKKVKGESEGATTATRSMFEQDMAGSWRIGPILVPNTYVAIILMALYVCTITIGGFAERLAEVL